MICSRPPLSSSTPARPRTRTAPRPVSKYERIPAEPWRMHQAIEGNVRVLDLRADAVDALAEIVRRDIRRHADGDARAAVDEEIWERRGEHDRLHETLVVGRDEVDCLLVHVVHERGAEPAEPGLGVTHGRRWIAFDGPEIALPVDQHVPHVPRLRD